MAHPPLRSLRWIEAILTGLAREGFSDQQVLFTYRMFDSFYSVTCSWKPVP